MATVDARCVATVAGPVSQIQSATDEIVACSKRYSTKLKHSNSRLTRLAFLPIAVRGVSSSSTSYVHLLTYPGTDKLSHTNTLPENLSANTGERAGSLFLSCSNAQYIFIARRHYKTQYLLCQNCHCCLSVCYIRAP